MVAEWSRSGLAASRWGDRVGAALPGADRGLGLGVGAVNIEPVGAGPASTPGTLTLRRPSAVPRGRDTI
jgi:hypothetical protein